MNDAALAERWYAAWNAHDVEAVLALYADDIEFSSPYIAALGLSADGVVEDKAMLRAYFELGLARIPDLKFTPESLCIGARGHTLIYRNHRGERVVEHHQLDAQGLIVRADAAYETT
ncbi:MAG TPA: nuclear transport factor 2 family protein [Caulobacterales bacterium]|nr:nuclear transport factor 2 family protein [Caulobacterales bacterium]